MRKEVGKCYVNCKHMDVTVGNYTHLQTHRHTHRRVFVIFTLSNIVSIIHYKQSNISQGQICIVLPFKAIIASLKPNQLRVINM